MRTDRIYLWILEQLLERGEISVEELEDEFGADSDETLFGTDYLRRYAQQGILARDAGVFVLKDRGQIAEQYRDLAGESPPRPLDFETALVVSIPSSLRSEWDVDMGSKNDNVPIFSLKEALQQTITAAEDELYLSVPFFELDGFNALESEFLEVAERGVRTRVLTREIFTPRNEDSIFHSKKLKALRELFERYQSVASEDNLIQIRDFYHQIGPGNSALDMSIHSKMAIADNSVAYIGSGEIRDSSMNLNGEAGYLIGRESDAMFWKQFFEFFWQRGENVSREYLESQIE